MRAKRTALVKIVFIARHYSYLRLFESAIVALARSRSRDRAGRRPRRDDGRPPDGRADRRQLPERHDLRRAGPLHRRLGRGGAAAAARPRLPALSASRGYVETPHLRQRAQERAPRLVVRLAESPLGALVGGRRGLAALLGAAERGLPIPAAMRQFLLEQQPDVVLITPLIDIGSPQLDHFAAARALGIRTVLPVGSWDHLSSKALLRVAARPRGGLEPDAAAGGGRPARRAAGPRGGDRRAVLRPVVRPRSPSRSREDFCARVGLDPDRPFVLYTCSSLFRGTVSEPEFVEAWIRALRTSSDPRLKGIGILIRPHPARLDEWRGVDLSGHKNLVFWGAHPVDAEAKDDYFDSMYYSAGVVGINTSAFIEAAVVGKPVHTVLLPEMSRDNQEGTLHFRYLLNVNGGLLRAARSLRRARGDAGRVAGAGRAAATRRPRRFVDGFVRPFGRGGGRHAAIRRRDRGGRHAAGAGSRAPIARSLAGVPGACIRSPSLLALHLRSQPWRKRTRHRLVKQLRAPAHAGAAADQAVRHRSSGRRRQAAQVGDRGGRLGADAQDRPPARSREDAGRHRLARGAAHARAGHGAGAQRPADHPRARGCRRPGSSCSTGFRSSPGPRPTATSTRRAWWWCRAAARRRGTATSPPTTRRSSRSTRPTSSASRNEGRIDEQEGRQKHLEISSFDREIIDRVRGASSA